MKRAFLVPCVAMLVTVAMVGGYALLCQAPVCADEQDQTLLVGRWHRLDPYRLTPTPTHEVLRCGGNATWNCVYDKHPEPLLGFEHPPDSVLGQFGGEDITSDWTCPTWFSTCIGSTSSFARGSGVLMRRSRPTHSRCRSTAQIGRNETAYSCRSHGVCAELSPLPKSAPEPIRPGRSTHCELHAHTCGGQG
jgi:hypothetical protein